MNKVQIEIESIGIRGWYVKFTSGSGGREYRPETWDGVLDVLSAAHNELGAPPPRQEMPPSPPMPPAPPRTPRHRPRHEAAEVQPSPVAADTTASIAPLTIPAPIGKREAARMREAADDAAVAADPVLRERIGMLRTRKL